MIENRYETQAGAWMERVLEEHRQLRQMVAELREFLGRPRPAPGQTGAHSWAAELSEWLVKLHDGLFRHFRYEERSGMVEDITMLHPRRTTEIEGLMAEHGEMLAGIKQLMTEALDYSEGQLLDDPSLRTRLIALLDQFAEHERAESDLVQRSALQEVGTGD